MKLSPLVHFTSRFVRECVDTREVSRHAQLIAQLCNDQTQTPTNTRGECKKAEEVEEEEEEGGKEEEATEEED